MGLKRLKNLIVEIWLFRKTRNTFFAHGNPRISRFQENKKWRCKQTIGLPKNYKQGKNLKQSSILIFGFHFFIMFLKDCYTVHFFIFPCQLISSSFLNSKSSEKINFISLINLSKKKATKKKEKTLFSMIIFLDTFLVESGFPWASSFFLQQGLFLEQ